MSKEDQILAMLMTMQQDITSIKSDIKGLKTNFSEPKPQKQALSKEEVDDVIKSLTGILKGNYDLDQVREERLREKYELTY